MSRYATNMNFPFPRQSFNCLYCKVRKLITWGKLWTPCWSPIIHILSAPSSDTLLFLQVLTIHTVQEWLWNALNEVQYRFTLNNSAEAFLTRSIRPSLLLYKLYCKAVSDSKVWSKLGLVNMTRYVKPMFHWTRQGVTGNDTFQKDFNMIR